MRPWSLTALLIAILLIGGCGGGSDEESTTSEATVSQAEPQPTEEPSGSEAQERAKPSHKAQIENPPIAKERVPGQKAVAPGVPTTKGGDNSIQAFGVESEEGEASQGLANLREYLEARLAGDWAKACALASEEYRSQLEMLIERAKAKEEGAQKPEGCAETISLLLGRVPASQLETLMPQKLLSFRVEGPYAYLIYEDGEGTIRFIAMAEEDGAWKVNVPEAEAFQASQGESQ